jgi:hypothetical protein
MKKRSDKFNIINDQGESEPLAYEEGNIPAWFKVNDSEPEPNDSHKQGSR